MKLKYTEIASALGLSKAAVSLAVNNKPGVSEETRRKVLEFIRKIEENSPAEEEPSRTILFVYFQVNTKHALNGNYPVYTDVFNVFASEAASRHFRFSTVYASDASSKAFALQESMRPDVVAVILFGTIMKKEDYLPFRVLNKPILIYDNEAPDAMRSSVCVDSLTALRLAVNALDPAGTDSVKYIACDEDIYNTEARRKAFVSVMLERGRYVDRDDYIHVDYYSQPAALQLEEYFRSHPLPDCIIAENYTTAIGLLSAMRTMQICIPDRVRIVSIDELPEYVPGKERIWQVRIPHAERAVMLMDLLELELRRRDCVKQRVLAIPTLLEPEFLKQS